MAGEVMRATLAIRDGIQEIEGLKIVGDPDMSVLAFTSENTDIFSIGDALSERGWHLDRLQFPDGLHLTVTKLNVGKEKTFLKDLQKVMDNTSALNKAYKASKTTAKVADGLLRVLPPSLFKSLSRLAGSNTHNSGKRSSYKQAALYGVSATLRNREKMKRFVEDLLDDMY